MIMKIRVPFGINYKIQNISNFVKNRSIFAFFVVLGLWGRGTVVCQIRSLFLKNAILKAWIH